MPKWVRCHLSFSSEIEASEIEGQFRLEWINLMMPCV